MQKSETIGELAKALAAAQAEIQNAKKDSENPFFKSNYADLASVREACKTALSKNGLAIVQMPGSKITEDVTIVSVETLLMHSSGEWVSGEIDAIPTKHDPQGIGSCITYLRRYALAAAAGVAAEDDDGNAASHGSSQQTRKQAPPKRTDVKDNRKILVASVADAFKVLNKLGDQPQWSKKSANEYVAVHFQGVDSVDNLTDEQVNDLLRMLTERIDALKKPSPLASAIHVDAERTKLIEAITKEANKATIDQYLEDHSYKVPVEKLSLDALNEMHDNLVIPF